MAIFRPGKPWLWLRKNSGSTQTSGIHKIVWQVADMDGDWTLDGVGTGTVQLAHGGLWDITLNVARTTPASASNVTSRLEGDGVIIGRTRGPSDATAYGTSLAMHYYTSGPGSIIEAFCQLHASATATFETPTTSLFIKRSGPIRYTS